MSDLIEVMKKRRSVRKFRETPVDQEKIDRVLQAALLAPSSRGIFPCDFILVTDKNLLTRLSSSKTHGSSFIGDAPAAVVVIADTSRSDVWIEDASIAAVCVHLAAQAEGLGSCWVQIRKRDHSPDMSSEAYIRDLLSIPDGWAVECVIPMGYPDEAHPPRELGKEDFKRVRKNGF